MRVEQLDVVVLEGAVRGDDGQVLELRLRDQQPIERVGMVEWQGRHRQRVRKRHWQRFEAAAIERGQPPLTGRATSASPSSP